MFIGMITRIFRVKIYQELKNEFEEKFATISVTVVENAKGSISETIYKPIKWSPNEYAMISVWESEGALQAFVGEDWNRAFIPKEMEKFVAECWVHHYESWE